MNSSPLPLCDLFDITPHEVALRQAFLEIDEADDVGLDLIRPVIHDNIDSIINEFYTHLLKFDEPARFLTDRQTLERLRQSQKQYLLTLGANTDSLEYFENRLRIGTTHERVGLKQKWYIGGYRKLFEIIAYKLLERYQMAPEKLLRTMVTMHKFMTLDIVLAVETYYQATMQRLEAILRQFSEAQQQLQQISRLDGLTQVNNRRFLMESLEMESHRAQRFNHPFTVLLVDVDHFKEINDTMGHAFGDFVLQKVVRLMRDVIRTSDIVGRYGGEEFVIGLVETDLATAHQIAERIRLKIALTPFEMDDKSTSVTLSIGVASLTPDIDRVEQLIARADEALYRAKNAGRNRVEIIDLAA